MFATDMFAAKLKKEGRRAGSSQIMVEIHQSNSDLKQT